MDAEVGKLLDDLELVWRRMSSPGFQLDHKKMQACTSIRSKQLEASLPTSTKSAHNRSRQFFVALERLGPRALFLCAQAGSPSQLQKLQSNNRVLPVIQNWYNGKGFSEEFEGNLRTAKENYPLFFSPETVFSDEEPPFIARSVTPSSASPLHHDNNFILSNSVEADYRALKASANLECPPAISEATMLNRMGVVAIWECCKQNHKLRLVGEDGQHGSLQLPPDSFQYVVKINQLEFSRRRGLD